MNDRIPHLIYLFSTRMVSIFQVNVAGYNLPRFLFINDTIIQGYGVPTNVNDHDFVVYWCL